MKFGINTAVLLALVVPISGFAYIDSNLKVGSTGSDVTLLQEMLVMQGYLVIPEGVSLGYFGELTRDAVVKWQEFIGLPATGYFGPMSREAWFNEVESSETLSMTAMSDTLASTSSSTIVSLRSTPHPASPDVKVISKSISPVRAIDGSISSATSKIKIKITANDDAIYLNGDNESTDDLQFVNVTLYGSGITSSTTATTTSYEITSGSDYTVTNDGSDDEYYTLDEGESMLIEITSKISQDVGTVKPVSAGVKIDTLRFGIENTSDETRAIIDMDLTYLGEQVQSGTIELQHE